ncbi:MAG: CBS domain-containing protein [Candidatus Hydrogenedentes bacterium]|nr:CBS domain-containing protein [Candidatus Hydrogenedentota bacterium]
MHAVPIVREIMVEAHFSILPTMSAFDAVDMIATKKLTGIPVIDEDERLVGFLTEKDCLRLQVVSHQYNMTGRTVKDIMSTINDALGPDQDILAASMVFLACNFATLPVINGDRLVGCLSRKNIVVAILKFHRDLGADKQSDKNAQELVNNPSSIEQLQALVSQSNNAQLASVLTNRHHEGNSE